MKQQITYTLSHKEIEDMMRKNLVALGFKNIDSAVFTHNGSQVEKGDLEYVFIADEEDLGENHSLVPKEKSADELAREKLLATPLHDFDLSVRAVNFTRHNNMNVLGDVVSKYKESGNTWREFMKMPNSGRKTLDELEALLKEKKLI